MTGERDIDNDSVGERQARRGGPEQGRNSLQTVSVHLCILPDTFPEIQELVPVLGQGREWAEACLVDMSGYLRKRVDVLLG